MTETFMDKAPPVNPRQQFESLRTNGWQPRLHLTESVAECADHINRPHEDYPARVNDTIKAIDEAVTEVRRLKAKPGEPILSSDIAVAAHRRIFSDHGDQAGRWRRVNVRVADHIAPDHQLVGKLMTQLDHAYALQNPSRRDLEDWHFCYETVHPFRDGNGRTGGVTIAAIHFALHGIYLTPGE